MQPLRWGSSTGRWRRKFITERWAFAPFLALCGFHLQFNSDCWFPIPPPSSAGGTITSQRPPGAHQLRRHPAPDGQDPAGDQQLQTGLKTAARRWDHANEPGQVGSLRDGITAHADTTACPSIGWEWNPPLPERLTHRIRPNDNLYASSWGNREKGSGRIEKYFYNLQENNGPESTSTSVKYNYRLFGVKRSPFYISSKRACESFPFQSQLTLWLAKLKRRWIRSPGTVVDSIMMYIAFNGTLFTRSSAYCLYI